MRIVQLMTDRSRYFNPSKNYWFSFNTFLISLIGLYFRCLSFRVVLVNTARPDGAFLFVVWFIHWKHMIRPFLFIDIYESTNTPNVYLQCVGIFYYRSRVNHSWKKVVCWTTKLTLHNRCFANFRGGRTPPLNPPLVITLI